MNTDTREALAALQLAKKMCNEALPKFNWGASALDANAIRLLNETPQAINAAIAALATQPAQSSAQGEAWVVARQTAVDVGDGDDVRTGGRPELGYALIEGSKTFPSEAEAMGAIRKAGLPLGWVALRLSRLFTDMLSSAPAAPAQPSDELQRLRAEAEALRKDAARWRYINTTNNIWRRDDGAEPPYSMLCVVLPYGADLSCRATRENAIDAAIAATKEQQA